MKLSDFTHNLRVGDYDCGIVQHLSLKDAPDVHNAVEKYLAVNILVNALTAEVGTMRNLSGFPTSRELANSRST